MLSPGITGIRCRGMVVYFGRNNRFRKALDYLASGLILVHNHPSGNRKPSEPDKRLTSRLTEVGKSLEIPVLDHLIFTDVSYLSFADEGLI